LNLTLGDFRLFSKIEFADRIEYTFWTRANLEIDAIDLLEGQKLQWFSENQVKKIQLAYGFNEIIEEFFSQAPFDRTASPE
jgi:8-oxo-dGTP diphosphatase